MVSYEKYARQIGSFPEVGRGENFQKYVSCHHLSISSRSFRKHPIYRRDLLERHIVESVTSHLRERMAKNANWGMLYVDSTAVPTISCVMLLWQRPSFPWRDVQAVMGWTFQDRQHRALQLCAFRSDRWSPRWGGWNAVGSRTVRDRRLWMIHPKKYDYPKADQGIGKTLQLKGVETGSCRGVFLLSK